MLFNVFFNGERKYFVKNLLKKKKLEVDLLCKNLLNLRLNVVFFVEKFIIIF